MLLKVTLVPEPRALGLKAGGYSTAISLGLTPDWGMMALGFNPLKSLDLRATPLCKSATFQCRLENPILIITARHSLFALSLPTSR